MAGDKHSQDAVAKLYAEWVSAGVKLSVAGFAATTKIMEAATQSLVSSRSKAPAASPAAPADVKTEASAAAPVSLKIVPTVPAPEPAAAATTFASKATQASNATTAPKDKQAPKSKAARQAASAFEAAPVAGLQAVAHAAAAAATPGNDLKLISGIGPKLEQMLIRRGITAFAQLAALRSDDAAKLDAELNLNGRVLRDDWIGQAAKLAGT
jgi:NADH-quinone oxidoreductase subunit E